MKTAYRIPDKDYDCVEPGGAKRHHLMAERILLDRSNSAKVDADFHVTARRTASQKGGAGRALRD